MGYTHYWNFNKPKGAKIADLEKAYQTAIKEIGQVARIWQKEHPKGSDLDHMRLSGYTAHVKKNSYGGCDINGKGDLAHENFVLRDHFSQALKDGGDFCKTAQKPYDTVIVACLAILKYRLGDAIEVSSDGDATDWIEGVALARRCTARVVPNPLGTGLKIVA